MEDKKAPVHNTTRAEVSDHVRGAVYGLCIGSSLGGAVLGLNHRQIAGKAGISGLHELSPALTDSILPHHQAGDLLSDALMALTLAESLINSKGRFSPEDFQKRIRTLLEDEAFLQSGPTVQVLQSLRAIADGQKAGDVAENSHVSGAARAALLGCLPAGDLSDSPVEVAVKQAQLGGGDGRVAAAAAVVADSVRYFVSGGRLESEYDVQKYVLHEFAIAGKLDERFSEAWDDIAPDLDYTSQAKELPYSLINVESSASELIPTAVGIFLIYRQNPEEAIVAAARAGGDTDTVAAVVGALVGAYHGASKLPERWVSQIAQKEKLDSVAQRLCELWA